MYASVTDDGLRTLALRDAVAIDRRNREIHERGLQAAHEAHQVAAKKMHTIYNPVTAQTPPSMVTRWHEVQAMTVSVPAGRVSDAVVTLCAMNRTCGVDYLPQNAEVEARSAAPATSTSPYKQAIPSAPPPNYPDVPAN